MTGTADLYQGALIMTHLMARGGRVPLAARCVALRLWCPAPRRDPRLTSGKGNPVKGVIINEHWY